MKKSLLTIVSVFLLSVGFSQTILFQEDFEGSSINMTSSSASGTKNWAVTTTLASQGAKSDTAVVAVGDTIMLTTATINATAMSFVQLEFDHICKLEFFDAGLIEVSTNNGATWTQVTTGYLGTGQFPNIGNKFNSTAYVDWVPANGNAIPNNTWWKHETFNLSTYVANNSQVKIRFKLADGNNSGAAGNYGWLVDNIKVTASFSELIPPAISLITPYPIDTAYTSGPFDVKAHVTDNTGIDTVLLVYWTSSGVHDTLGMSTIATDTFKASIPFYGYGRTINYFVKAIDSSPAHNTDSVGPIDFFCKYSPGGTFVVGTGTNNNGTYDYPAVFGQYYTGDREQYLILASELQAINAVGGAVSSIAFDVVTANSATSTGANHNNFTIKLKNTSVTTLSSTFETGLTQVYTVGSYQTSTGWNNFNFSTPFVWDGVSNLLVEVCFDNYVSSGDYSDNTIVNRTQTTHNGASYYRSDGGGVCTYSSSTTSTYRPNMKFVMATPSNITNDAGISAITNPTGGVVANQSFPIKVKVKNYGVDTLFTATINWKFDGVAQTAYSFSDTLLPGAISNEITLGNKTVTGGSHYLLTWTDNPNGVGDFNVANDSASIGFYACSSLLNGTYTIGGTNPDYATFNDAVLALNQCGISGPVTFNVAAGTYNEKIELFAINGSSATNKVIFKAANNDSTSVILKNNATGTVDNFVVKLNGASYVSFKNMTIEAADSTYSRAVVLGGVLHDISLENNIIKNTIPSTIDDNNGTVIFSIDSIGGNILVLNNKIVNGSRGLEFFSNIPRTGWQIIDNQIEDHFAAGVNLTNGLSSVVEGNLVKTTSTTASYNGISMQNCSGTPVISKNNIQTTNTQIGYGIVALNSEFDALYPAQIFNNFILINANSSANTLSGGILVANSPNIGVYYNTAHMAGNHSVSASLILYDQVGTPNTSNIKIKNNILTNAANGYIYWTTSVDTNDFVNNYNNIYHWNTGKFGRLGTTDILTYPNWKTQSGGDINGDTIDPYYSGAADLHVNNNLLNGRAIPMATITDDIDGDPRSATAPDFGADEFVPSPYDITTLEVIAPAGGCGLDTNETVIVRYKNVGSATINGNLTASYRIIGTSTVVTETVSAQINAGDTLDYSFNTKANLSVAAVGFDSTFTIKAWADLTGDNVGQNDTVLGDIESGYVPGPITVADDTVLYGHKDTVYASGLNIYWWATDTSTIELANDTVFITPFLYDTTTFWVSDRAGLGQMDVLIGNGTNVNGSTSYPSTYANWYWGNKEQYLILASELQAMGLSSGPLTSVSFNVSTVNSVPPLDNFEISIGHTTTSSLSSWISGLTTVFSQSTGYITSNGWNTHTFNAPFIWDGVSNVVVQVCSNNSSYLSNGNAGVLNHSTTFTATLNTHDDASGVCAYTSVTPYQSRPNMKFAYVGQGCYGVRTPFTIYVTGFPQYDAALDSTFISPVGSVPSGTPSEIKTVLHNFGQVTLTSVKIPYKVNGVIQDTLLWTGSLPYGASDTIVIDTITFNGGIINLMAYTTMPNNIVDIYNTNDTAKAIIQSCLSGNYRIGNINNGANFPSFTAALNALNVAGICGHVVFNVDSGVYTEQLNISPIAGMNASNTVTFQSITGDSSDVILQFASTLYSDNYTVKLNGADYFTFKSMTIKALDATYGGVVEMGTGATYNRFLNNKITCNAVNSSYMRGIYMTSGANHYNRFENNLIENTYYGFYLYGISTTSLAKGNIVKNNLILNNTYYGVYGYYNDSLQIEGNTITDNAALSGYGYGIYLNYCDGATRANKNKITFSPTYYKYGIQFYYCDGTPTQKGQISNNMISIKSGTGTSYGIYAYYSTNLNIYYNTVNHTMPVSGSRALYVIATSATNPVNIQNNILRDSLGYTLYASSNTGIGICDYNSFYSNSASFAYWGGNRANLAALQTASGKDAHSVTVDPIFFGPNDLHMLSTQLSGLGNPVSAVIDDIDGEIRSTLGSTIGADEVPLLPFDVGVSQILNVPATTNENQSVPFSVVIKNYGTDTVYSFAIHYTVNGGTPVVYNYTDTFPTSKIDTVVMTPFNSPAGNSQICAFTVLSSDSNAFNDGICKNFFGIPVKDAMVSQVIEMVGGCALTTDTVRIWVKNIGVDSINGAGQTVPTVNYKSNTALTVTENFTNIVAPGDSVLHVFQTPVSLATNNTNDSTFNIAAWIDWIGDNVSYNDTAYTSVYSSHVPSLPIVTSPVQVPYGSAITINVTSVDTILWFNHLLDTAYFHMGSSYTTPFMYNDDTVYVSAMNGLPELKITEVVQYKTGTGATNPYPTYMSTGDFDGLEITNIGSGPQFLGGWTIHVRGTQTIDYTFPPGTVLNAGEVITCLYVTGVTVGPAGNNMFYIANSTSISSNSAVGYILKNNQGVVVDAVSTNNHIFSSSDGVTSADWTGTVANLSGYAGAVRIASDNNTPSDWLGTNSTTASFGAPNGQLTGAVSQGCTSAKVPIVIDVTGQLSNDVGLIKVLEPVSAINLTATEDVTIRVKNFGTSSQSNIKVGYKLNNGTPVYDSIASTIVSGDSLDYTFPTKANLSQSGQTYHFKLFTAHTGDNNHLNDTMTKTVTNQIPNYCLCTATSTGYEDLTGISIGTWSYQNAPVGAMYTDYTSVTPTAIVGPGLTYPISVTTDFPSGYSYQYPCWVNVFIDFNRDGDFTDAGELCYSAQSQSSATVSGTMTVPFNALSGVTRMRVVMRESGALGDTGPCNSFTWGECEDYNILVMTPIPNDAGVELIKKPTTLPLTATVPVEVRIRNYGTQVINSVQVAYKHNNGTPVTMTYSNTIQPMDSVDLVLGNVTLTPGANSICAYTILQGDSNTLNDQKCKSVFREAVVNITYTDNFEGSDLWMPDTVVNQWSRGIPSMTNINSAHSPVNVWAIGIDTTYNNSSNDFLYSPRILIPANADSAHMKFWHYYNLQSGASGDGAYIQYRINSGFWANLGYVGDTYGTNWNNMNVGGTHVWNGNSNGWIQSKYAMKFNDAMNSFYGAQGDTVQFRFIFYSNSSTNNFDGWAIDDFEVSLPKINYDGGVVAITSPGSSTQTGSAVSVNITVRNFGLLNLASIPVSYRINTGSWVNETFTPASPLMPDSTATYSFSTTYTSPGTAYNLCAKTQVAGDVYVTNDQMCASVTTTQAAIDGAITNLTATPIWPGTTVDTTKQTYPVKPIVEVTNMGTTALSNVIVRYKINAGTWVQDTLSGPIAPSASVNHQCKSPFTSPIGSYALYAEILITGDADLTNNTDDIPLYGVLDIGIEEGLRNGFIVLQNEPNPASDITRISYIIPTSGNVRFELVNALGQTIQTISQQQVAGEHSFDLNVEPISNGVYYYTISFGNYSQTMKLVVRK